LNALQTSRLPEEASAREQDLARLQQEVRRLRSQLRQSQRLAAVGTMTAMVAHEFNNILTPIINYANLAKRNPKMVDKAIARAADGGAKCTHICQAILGLTSASNRPSQAVDLRELVACTVAAMAREPKRDMIDLDIRIPDGLRLHTRPVELQQVLLNLLINARAAVLASQGGRSITVSAERAGRQVKLRVADSGIGIPPQNLERIFEPFFSTRSGGDDETNGHGLGLAICREVISDLGGSISVDSTEGQGATFTILIPA